MLTPKSAEKEPGSNPIMSIRLNAGETARVDWLTDHLNMSRSELVKALINQEYMAQFEAPEHAGPGCDTCPPGRGHNS
jgi:hypothetical protein